MNVHEIEAIKKVMALPQAEIASARALLRQNKPFFCRVTDAFNGTCRFYAFVFTAFGIVLAFMGKLTAEYVALTGSIQALVTAHSMGQDYHERNTNGQDIPPAA